MANDKLMTNERHRSTIGFQLLFAVNVSMTLLAVIFLGYDYRREMSKQLEEKRIALDEEAKTLLPAAVQIYHHGRESVQRYIDTVCGRMQEAQSPGHHIVVVLGDETFQAEAHHRASPEVLQAVQRGAQSKDRRARLGDTELIVGEHEQDNAAVYVSERLENLRRSVRGDVLRRLGGLVALAFVAAVVVNFVLWRIVTRPLQQLVTTVQEIGKGSLGTQAATFRSAEFNFLASEINSMSDALAAADRDRHAQMAKACEIQQNLLPQEAEIPGLDVACLFEPADDIGGDYYDVVRLSDGAWLFCIADVTGHGIPAAMNAAMLKTMLQQASEQFNSPAEILQIINRRFLSMNLEGDFVSAVLLCADPATARFHYASAGHEPAWLLNADGTTRELSSTGPLLGVVDATTWETTTLDAANGDRFVIVTDGVTESQNPAGEFFGRQRFAELIAKSQSETPHVTSQHIARTLANFRNGARQHDDITAVIIDYSSE